MDCCEPPHKLVFFEYECVCTKCGLVMDSNYQQTSYSDLSNVSILPGSSRDKFNAFHSQRRRHHFSTVRADMKDIRAVATRESIPKSTVDMIMTIWKNYSDKATCRKGKNRTGVLGVCFHRGLLACGDLRTRQEICKMFDISEPIFRKGEKLLTPYLSTEALHDTTNVFYNRFCRLVSQNRLPFNLVGKMNALYNKHATALQTFPNHVIVASIFVLILFDRKGKTTTYRALCKEQKLSIPAFMKIKNAIAN